MVTDTDITAVIMDTDITAIMVMDITDMVHTSQLFALAAQDLCLLALLALLPELPLAQRWHPGLPLLLPLL